MSKYIKNASGIPQTWLGQLIANGAYYHIQPQEEVSWANDSEIMTAIGSGDAVVAKSDDGTTDISDVNTAIDYIKGNLPTEVDVKHQPAFADKTIDGKSLFNRTHGLTYSLTTGTNSQKFTVTYPHAKFNGLEIVGAEVGDTASLKVLDSSTGSYTSFPDFELNQFGWDVAIAPGFYKRLSDYDADLFIGMQVEIVYDSVSDKDIYVNYLLHEVK